LPETSTAPELAVRQHVLRRYAVILHNDDVHDMVGVVQAILKSIPGMGTLRATQVMLDAHLHGEAVVITCPLEQAEYYQQRLQTFGLSVTIRPV
jgi:ATP-dependent Clp protease adaptor protein ClpS